MFLGGDSIISDLKISNVLLLGSTGSIGISALEVIKHLGDSFNIVALSTNQNIDLLEEQIGVFNPEIAVVVNELKAEELKNRIGNKCRILAGSQALQEITRTLEHDILISALVGFAGLEPTIESIKRGKRIALANKETLVVAGEIIMSLAQQYNSDILPVDSEHSAIFQCLVGENIDTVNKLILTASGGPFYNKSFEDLESVSIKEALNHPNWSMGNKITIDSATMMNKGLEVIEANWLFGLPKEKIEVIIHPQSIIHSIVEYCDGSMKAQLSFPDMKLPIQYALTYPNRLPNNFVLTKLTKIGSLNFFEPDIQKFECLKLAFAVMEEGGTAPCILNAANEFAVDRFLSGRIKFLQIPEVIKVALDKIENHNNPDIETIIDCDRTTRELLRNFYN